jgi:hypothetical protein
VAVAIFAVFAIALAFAALAAAFVALAAFVTWAAFVAAAGLAFAAALATSAFVALAAAFIALAAFVTFVALATATALVADQMTASVFKDEAVRATRDGNRLAVTTPEFIARRTRGRRSRNAHSTAHFIAPRTVRRRNDTAVTAVEHIAGRTFGTVLVEAGATATGSSNSSDATGPGHRASSAEHEKSDGENCRQALPHEKSLLL